MGSLSSSRSISSALYRRYLSVHGMRTLPDNYKVFVLVFLAGFVFFLFFSFTSDPSADRNKKADSSSYINQLSNSDSDTDKLDSSNSIQEPTPSKEINSADQEHFVAVLPERIHLKEGNNSAYFTPRNSTAIIGCFNDGSVNPEPGSKYPCFCKSDYYGPHCSIPNVVMTSACQLIDNCKRIRARTKPRRVVHFFNFHHELDHAEVQLGELGDVVDVFVIGESNRTTSGEPNELLLQPKMKNEGFLKEYHHKIIYVMIPSTAFPDDPNLQGGRVKGGGWISDSFIRNYIGKEGLSRIDGLEDDDLIILTDIDEFINKDVVQFLKFHDGYPEPVRVNFRESEYTYYWKRTHSGPDGQQAHFPYKNDKVACTVGMLRQVYDNRVMLMRRGWDNPTPEPRKQDDKMIADGLIKYGQDGKHNVSDTFAIGRFENNYAAYHCTWCYKPEGIRAKWIGRNRAQNEFPDWGPNKEKLSLEYIASAVKKGNLFGDKMTRLYKVTPLSEGDTNFAPAYVWKHKDRFGYLLYPDAPA